MWTNAQHDGRPAKYRWRLCSTPQNLAVIIMVSTTRVPCSNGANTRNPLKLAEVLQTPEPISTVSGPKFTILWGHVEEVLLFNKFFFQLSIHALVVKIQPDKVVRWCRDGDYLHPVFSASRVQYISDLNSKFALRPHYVWKYGRHPVCDR